MTTLTNLSPAASYGDLITCTNNGQGLTASLQNIQDGFGNNSAIQLSTTTLNVVGNFEVNGSPVTPIGGTTVNISSANITSMFGAPVQILPAPGAGNVYLIHGFAINYAFNTAAYTGGGSITLQYGNTPAAAHGVITSTISATAFNSTTNTFSFAPGDGTVVSGTQAYVNTAVYISNIGGAFATGSGTANVIVYYSIGAAV